MNNTPMTTAAIYARKSTDQSDVAEDQKSVTRQIEAARRFIAEKGWTLHNDQVYVDDGISGAIFAGRPEFQRMLRDADAGAFDHLAIFTLDRFGREAAHDERAA
jgi:site-specific DNA recombinase